MFDWIIDFFSELLSLIPKVIYLLNSALLSLIDFMQLLFRKLAGLDVYYITNDNGEAIATTGDLLTNFIGGILGININGNESFDLIDYSLLSTVFWSFVIFGLIILFISTLVAIIKSHYTYNEKSVKGPLPILALAGKAIVNMVAVPVIVILGLYLSQAILNALDQITAVGSDDLVNLYGSENTSRYLQQNITDSQGNQTYIFYDMFGYTGGILYGGSVSDLVDIVAGTDSLSLVAARTQPFSGSMFKVAGFNANRVRSGEYTVNTPFSGNIGSGMELFSNHGNDSDVLANMVDEAFANFLHLNDGYGLNFSNSQIGSVEDFGDMLIEAERFLTNFTCHRFSAYSKFNVGLVWYYYNLWNYNFIVGFGSVIVCVSIFLNIIMGLMSRLFMAIVLFLVMPPLAGLAPLDEGKAFGGWREAFMKQVLMAYGAVVGMNLVLLILPYINEIDMFGIPIVDSLVQTLFIIVGLITIKAVISTLSQLIGAADANKTGDDMSKEVKSTIGKATAMTIGAAKLGAMPYAAPIKKIATDHKINQIKAREGLGDTEADNLRAQEILDRETGQRRARVQAFLSGGFGGLRNERARQQAENDLRDANDRLQTQENNLQHSHLARALGDLTGTESEAQMRESLRQNGIDEQQINQVVAARAALGSRPATGDNLSRMLENMDHQYRDYVHSVGGRAGAANQYTTRYQTVQTARQAVEQRQHELDSRNNLVGYYQRHPGFVGGTFRGIGHFARTSTGAFGLGFGGMFDKDTMDAFGGAMEKMGAKPKGPNWDKMTAENSKATKDAINELTQEIRRMNRNNRP